MPGPSSMTAQRSRKNRKVHMASEKLSKCFLCYKTVQKLRNHFYKCLPNIDTKLRTYLLDVRRTWPNKKVYDCETCVRRLVDIKRHPKDRELIKVDPDKKKFLEDVNEMLLPLQVATEW